MTNNVKCSKNLPRARHKKHYMDSLAMYLDRYTRATTSVPRKRHVTSRSHRYLGKWKSYLLPILVF